MAARLAEFGIVPQWGTAFEGFAEAKSGKPVSKLSGPKGVEEFEADIVIGADGARSLVRKSLGLDFAGEGFPETFHLADVVYDRDIERDFVQARFQNPGVIAYIPVNKRTFRYISTLPDFKDRIQHPAEPVEIVWESTFKVSFRHVSSMQKGNVFLAGDAAHIHSPVGGRGMNLGIEDACWLAWLISEGRQGEYTSLRDGGGGACAGADQGEHAGDPVEKPGSGLAAQQSCAARAESSAAAAGRSLTASGASTRQPPPWLERAP